MVRLKIEKVESGETGSCPLLEMKAIHAFTAATPELNNFSLHVNTGEITCLLTNGASGRETFLKVLQGHIHPRMGQIIFNGEPVTLLSTAEIIRRGIAFVPDVRHIFPNLTVEENLGLGVYVRRERNAVREDMRRVFGLFPQLKSKRKQRTDSLKPPERQMLLFARALMNRPNLLCVDMPTLNLKPPFIERIANMLIDINLSGITILIVEQNPEIALSIATRWYILHRDGSVLHGEATPEMQHTNALRKSHLVRRTA